MASEDKTSLDAHNSMACEDIPLRGAHEVQECLEGQSVKDLPLYLANCEKNSGHKNFVPVCQLSVEHFPSGYQDKKLYDLTKALADLTVRISVKLTSPDRPEFVPGTKDPYPCYNTRGQNSLHTGTGTVRSVIKCTEELENYRTCPCPECNYSDTPSKVWWRVIVVTATHVVFDSSEARQSSCRLWFDDDKSPVVNIYGWKVGCSNIGDEACEFCCVTHDIEIGYKLNRMVWRFFSMCNKVCVKYSNRRDVDRLTIIVSHPHGCSKQVSVGHLMTSGLDHNVIKYYMNTYTNSTCPGSSGALVYRPGCSYFSSVDYSEGFNYSGIWGDIEY
ncbi:uncharacterized protein LOC131939939 [Physella acuta]|uniref:uncharacterized protein LOC131939939 n=1 Tax=Physella acuta TaxID=109671 RepID=UPI0027DC393D|nr:uncharacterized protein LOC131939939 [Physella acuta]